ncbi:MAG: hypothetical protein ABSC90_14560 [Acidimicrobiales bacterium]
MFTFRDTMDPNVALWCRIDTRPAMRCMGYTDHPRDGTDKGSVRYEGLLPGPHCFSVFVVDDQHGAGRPTTDCWTITTNATIASASGSDQSAGIDDAFSLPLEAVVRDRRGRPWPGVRVTFTAPSSSGASGTFARCPSGNPERSSCVVSTDRSGVAVSSVFSADSTPGGYAVTAGAPGIRSAAHFSLRNRAFFSISGDVIRPLYPGSTERVDLVVSNPNPSPISIERGSLTIAISTGRPACSSSLNFAVAHGLSAPVTIPPDSTKSLSGLDVPRATWPSITMVETHTDQDACEGARLILRYRAVATG